VNSQHQIKRGVSLYSYQEEYFLRKLTLEQCIAEATKLGANGIESIAEQMMPGFPKLSEEFYAQWHRWMEEYGATPTCHDAMLDTKLYKDRLLTEEESIAFTVRDLEHAKKLGCSVVRLLVSFPPELVEQIIPHCERLDIRAGIEVHHPFHFDHPWIMRHMEVIERTGTRHFGFVPDMAMYVKRYPRVIRDRAIRDGATESIVDFVCQAYETRALAEYVIHDVRKMGGNPLDIRFAESLRHIIWSNPKRLLEFMPWIFHIHAKFYEMLEDYTEYSIPYEEVVPVLIEGGYDGYLSSEYEGNRHIHDVYEVDSLEQVRRQQEMFKRLLGETQPEGDRNVR
jgi:sugar phosphate isomerase/epimerase